MQFQIVRSLSEGVFSSSVSIQSFGTGELEVIKELGGVTVNVGGSITGNVDLNATTGAVELNPSGTIIISFILNNNVLNIDDKFAVTYSADANRYSSQEALLLTPTFNKYKLAEAKCRVFEDFVQKTITAAVANIKSNETNFDKEATTDAPIVFNVPVI